MAKKQYNTKTTSAPASSTVKAGEATDQLNETCPLGRNNFILMAIAGAMIIVGFLLMLGGSSTEEAFNPDIFSTRRIIVGPAISFIGFIFMGYAIIRKPSDK